MSFVCSANSAVAVNRIFSKHTASASALALRRDSLLAPC